MNMIWLAFTTGLLGSLHCAGMCGPIAMSLPDAGKAGWTYYWQRFQYNFGRIISYASLGALAGIPGVWIKPAGWQQMLSIIAGSILVLSFFFVRLKGKIAIFDRFHNKVAKALSAALRSRGATSWLSIGILNGFLPCGLVYIALTGALVAGGLTEGAIFMLFFGLGTFPVMFVMSISGRWLPLKLKSRVQHILPLTSLVVGLLLVVRGMNLGIPYISPEVKVKQDRQTMECCESPHKSEFESR